MSPVATTGVGVTLAGAIATLQWVAKSRGIDVPDAVAGFVVALMIGGAHGAWHMVTVFVPRLGANSMPTGNRGQDVGSR